MRLVWLMLLLPVLSFGQDKLILVSPHWEGARYEFQEGFQSYYRERTGRKVEMQWLDVGATSEIIRFVVSQFQLSPQGIGVDVVYGGGNNPFIEFERRGLLERLDIKRAPGAVGRAAGVELNSPQGNWWGTAMTAFGIMCNRAVLEKLSLPVPKTWEELGDSRYHSWIGAADPRKSGSAHTLYEVILQAYGWEKGWQVLQKLGRNVREFNQNSSFIPKDVANGEVACGLTFDSYAWQQIKEYGDVLTFILPEGLSLIDSDGIAVLRGAQHREVAQMFVEFAISEEGQKLWLYRPGVQGGPRRFELSRLSVLPNLYGDLEKKSSIRINPFNWTPSFTYNNHKSSRRWNVLNELIGVFLIEFHSELAKAKDSALGEVARKVPSEEAVQKILEDGQWDDPYRRNELGRFWRQQMQSVLRGSKLSLWSKALPSALILLLLAYYLLKFKRTFK